MASYDTNAAAQARLAVFANERDAVSRRGQGIYSETFTRNLNIASTAMVTQSAYFCALGLLAGDLVTNISMGIGTAGVAVTLSKVGLYDATGVQLAASADQGTSWHSTGVKTIAMITPYTVTVSGLYYVCALAVFTSTAPAIYRGASAAASPGINNAVGAGAIPWGIQISQADLPSPATTIVGTTAQAFWAGVS